MILETANAQDARVEALWSQLDTRKQGHLDLNGLKRGLRKIDHPLKNADDLLKDVLKSVDADGNGEISYSEFHQFVRQTEHELWQLFRSIDRNNDGRLEKSELRAGFLRAGLRVPDSKLNQFFGEVDSNKDGVISFEEWRDFLLFIPAETPSLKAVMSYYSSTVQMNPEGDVGVNDELMNGLGTWLLHALFGSLIGIAKSHSTSSLPPVERESETSALMQSGPQRPATAQPPLLPPEVGLGASTATPESAENLWQTHVEPVLTACVPNPGYFAAGGVAGIVSRTTTAPLDRLKVYLIAQTSTAETAVAAAKSGAPVVAAKQGTKSLVIATKELWAAGGMRSLYAGNGLNVVKVMPESAVKFGAFEASKRMFAKIEGHGNPRDIHTWSKFMAGGFGGMVSQAVVYPLDTLKFRMQCETVSGGLHGNKLIIATAKKMWMKDGLRSFYRGLPMGLFGIFPYAAIDLGTFEYLKRAVTTRNAEKRGCHEEQAEPGSFMTAFIGGFSGAFGASLVYPLNLLRTRLQSQGTVLHPRTYTGIMDVTRQTIKGEGARGLFKGLTPNLLKVVPAVSITYVVYEKSKQALELH
ncbi:calcium dependent mitochondrial carrier protein [Diplodia corticola]|uniref:Mitochondrial thiamine pyrophosphate carrier 1 n=1 Tax=Diplodia corticola TaxID=236234 RepID=A0A1J9SAZ5_9PEZI|nr:calcium dependent mitochondrial carrier protein [Diplodia corticola]OJD37663.1 calcium dependent mitochondrial carrier protein [Diplodia corticola]